MKSKSLNCHSDSPATPQDGCRELWLNVLTAALEDARSKNERIRRQARAWFEDTRQDIGSFRWICVVLDLRVSLVRETAKRKLGEILKATPKNTGAKGIGTSAVPKENHTLPTYKEIKLDKKLAAHAVFPPDPERERRNHVRP